MSVGRIRFKSLGRTVEAEITNKGWRSKSPGIARYLTLRYPIKATTVGDPLHRAFSAAVKGESAEVLTEPPEPESIPGAIY